MVYAASFADIFKNSFLNNFESIDPWQIALAFAASLLLGIGIFFVYKHTFAGVLYSKSLGFSFIMLALVTTLVIMAVSSNMVLSLGMVGALSIVRFRSAIKEPVDIAFIFWALAVGIVNGAGLVGLSVAGSVIIGATVIIFANFKTKYHPYVLVIDLEPEYDEAKINALLKAKCKKFSVKSKTLGQNGADMTVEVRLEEKDLKIVNELNRFSFVRNAALISFNGDYAG
ncbi:MAG: DUF4956 domain-containing protein [Clostridia bacterium]|nr:DUF4956 domain-containing protein [Clostridia bacterium]